MRDQLVAGDVLAAQLWSTTAQQAIDAAPHLAFVYPAEGFPFYCDCAVILRESQPPRLAHQFLDYLLRPAVSAKIVESTKTATANAAARKLLPEAVRNHPALYPPPAVFERGEWPRTLPPPASDCATASGRKSSRRSATVCGSRPATPSRSPRAARDPIVPPASGCPGLLLRAAPPPLMVGLAKEAGILGECVGRLPMLRAEGLPRAIRRSFKGLPRRFLATGPV